MSSKLTALRRERPGRVTLEVDGQPWRTVTDDVVLRAGLVSGMELDRPTLRRLREEIARARAVALAGGAVARRDVSSQRLLQRLERARVRPEDARSAVGGLTRAGVVDDRRFAVRRARALAERGWGDAAIVAKLDVEGIEDAIAAAALAALAPEHERARTLVDGARDAKSAARLLARRGFDADTIEDVLGALDAAG